MARIGCAIVVSGGSTHSAKRMSSKPTTERSSGMRSPRPAGGADHAHRHLVVEAEDRRRRLGRCNRASAASAPDRIEKSPCMTMRSCSQPGTRAAASAPGEPIAAERAEERSGDDADGRVTEIEEMLHRLGGGLGVVDVHARHAELGAELAAVDNRRAMRRRLLHDARPPRAAGDGRGKSGRRLPSASASARSAPRASRRAACRRPAPRSRSSAPRPRCPGG